MFAFKLSRPTLAQTIALGERYSKCNVTAHIEKNFLYISYTGSDEGKALLCLGDSLTGEDLKEFQESIKDWDAKVDTYFSKLSQEGLRKESTTTIFAAESYAYAQVMGALPPGIHSESDWYEHHE